LLIIFGMLVVRSGAAEPAGCGPRYVDGEVRNCFCVFDDRDYAECRQGLRERCQEIADCVGPSLRDRPLLEAAARGDLGGINRAFSALDQAARRQAGELALCTAVAIGHLAAADALIDLGISPDARGGGGMPALLYPNGHRLPMLRLLLDRGANPDAAGGADITALIAATHEGLSAEARLLLERGADPNAATSITGATALIYAASNGDLELVRELLNRGARPDHKDQSGRTASDVARDGGHEEILRTLEAHR